MMRLTFQQRLASARDYAWGHRLPEPARAGIIVGRVGGIVVLADAKWRLIGVGLYTDEMQQFSKRPLMAFTEGGLAMISKIGRKWVLFSRKGKVLGEHKKKADAEAQETAINISKARARGHKIPLLPRRRVR